MKRREFLRGTLSIGAATLLSGIGSAKELLGEAGRATDIGIDCENAEIPYSKYVRLGIEAIRTLAEKGHAAAQHNLGWRYIMMVMALRKTIPKRQCGFVRLPSRGL